MILVADECIPPAMFRTLAEMLKKHRPPIQAQHLLDILGDQGIADDEWVPRLAEMDDAILLTGDIGRKTGPRLPVILPAAKVRGVFLAGKLQQEPVFYKMRAIMCVFPEILRLEEKAHDTRMKLVANRDGYKLNEWPVNKS